MTEPAKRPPFARVGSDAGAAPGIPVELPHPRWEAILRDLEARGVSGHPVLVSATAITWMSGALGCPQPGRSYAQSLVEGMRAIVEIDGAIYDYRFGRGDHPRLCTG
ncbi:hypothetical protein ACSBPH_11335 [Microbacterium sp. F51-2R]|uniref:hypothetical protein n=1 Tax=Microbacterium sp. F51-2R TaxID=3445777 RepID=UPI003FA07D24